MIKAQVLFTTGNYTKPEMAPQSQRQAALTVERWLKRVAANSREQKVPMVPVGGTNSVTAEEYETFLEILRNSGSPVPVGLMLNNQAIMWAEDERGLPKSLPKAVAILQCFDLTNRGRLPL